ncbi:MerR family transcriptional regulator [Nocardia pseudobrasiliensis]|uniref:DNA-binding transcriptional MerR regulator n=1 Tax=Nocardia pseudobrasiliensis TaxID=45979 RepID=A0A370IF63_9NOCA|nr:MerR family transcriptional regulator [Nocardia pseudobrasiliensis]RDI69358.1 DNA-binding transcriptional MerR regulator [Nocardia pseudobrasiliensis]
MDDDELYTIGELAALTGATVKAIRFYSDRGIVPPTCHSAAGYRLYDTAALARLELVRTLRDLGLDLATIGRVVERETDVAAVAAKHADALDVQIRILRLRRSVLRAVAEHRTDTGEMGTMYRLARLTDDERRRLVDDFVSAAFDGLDANPALVELIRSSLPDLPDEPAPGQLRAWMELAELLGDADFRAAVRRMAEYQARERAAGDTTGLHHELTEAVTAQVNRALAAGASPESVTGAAVVDDLMRRYARTFDHPDDPALRRWVLERLEVANDPRVERYWRLLSTVNGWPAPPEVAPVFTWFIAALRFVAPSS